MDNKLHTQSIHEMFCQSIFLWVPKHHLGNILKSIVENIARNVLNDKKNLDFCANEIANVRMSGKISLASKPFNTNYETSQRFVADSINNFIDNFNEGKNKAWCEMFMYLVIIAKVVFEVEFENDIAFKFSDALSKFKKTQNNIPAGG